MAGVVAAAALSAAWMGAAPPESAALQGTLPDARRWPDFVALSADFAFETDAAGNLVFLSAPELLGWAAAPLIGQPGTQLLAPQGGWFDPFAAGPAFRDRRVWLKHADGSTACLVFAATPILSGGDCTGMRGVAREVTVPEGQDATVKAALHRLEVVEHILRQMRQEVLAPRMMQVVLEGLSAALGASGAVVLDLLVGPGPASILHQSGSPPGALLPGLVEVLQVEAPDPAIGDVAGHPVLSCPSYTRFGDRAGLCIWRSRGAASWTEADASLASSATAIIRVVLEHEAIQRELALQARTDSLTGLLNRRSFVEEVRRRIDRLDRDQVPGTLMYVHLDCFKRLNDYCGQEVGDEALVLLAGLLRLAVRPSDLVARLAGNEVALWLDSSDELTAAERAEQLRMDVPAALAAGLPPLAPAMSASIGIAARHPHVAEVLEDVMRRADAAMSEVKRTGRAHWRVARTPAI